MAAPLRRAAAAAAGWAAARRYRAAPLRRSLDGEYRPDAADRRTPPWQLEARYEARRFGRWGAAAAVAAGRLWPGPRRLRQLEAEEREWCPALRDLQAALERSERLTEQRRVERTQRVAAALERLPGLVAAWRRGRAAARERARAEGARRAAALAAAAGGVPGGGEDPRARAALLDDLERQRRRQEKRRRREARLEAARQALAAAHQAAAAAPPPQ
ncbi:large ribosomal subunit protein mL64 [Struthio camelus]|uniref:large ribosomal subunit protein mL64 n=1 Tax=Struthio camelus TaxID=8801 RepID=UPI00360403FF